MVLTGIHHITAICGQAQSNVDFYSGLLGLRLVKVTVNFDDPASYHLYYGDEVGSPGTCLTFFAWPTGAPGKPGSAQATRIGFSIPKGTGGWWRQRLLAGGARLSAHITDEPVRFIDPDGIHLELVETDDARVPWVSGSVDEGHAIRGFHSVTLSVGRIEQSCKVLEHLGFLQVSKASNRFAIGSGNPGQLVVLYSTNEPSTQGVGTIHHVAFATPDDAAQADCSQALAEFGLRATPVQDRQYFHSIYFREPSGVLYEIATSIPGFAIDEPVESLGTKLCLPPWMEKFRLEIESGLPQFETMSGVRLPRP